MSFGRTRRPRRRDETSPFGNPILIGALTVLVTIVAVALAYNATNGLPFVPTYDLHIQAADGSELTHGANAYLGGALVGTVTSVTPTRVAGGKPIALINVRLYKSIEPLPVTSRFIIRLKGTIGLKYLQIVKGTAARSYPNGATVPLRQESTDVDFDRVLSMFDAPTRLGVARSTVGFGQALAGRGGDINDAIGAFVPLVRDLEPVMTNLASGKTDLAGFLRGLESYNSALVPVAETNATLLGNLDTTFRAISGVAVPYFQETISRTPPFFASTVSGSPVIRPFLTDTAGLFRELRPGAATLTESAPQLAAAFAAGTRNLPGTAALDRRTVTLAGKLASYSANPAAQGGLDRLTLTLSKLGPPLAFITPAQTSCNYVTLFLRNTQSLLSEHVSQGGFLRFVQIAITDIPGAPSEPSSKPYTGPKSDSAGPLHSNPYPYTNSPGQPAECAAGNEPYPANQTVIGNPPGKLPLSTEATKRSASVTKGSSS